MLGLSSCKGLLPESLESPYSRDESCRLQTDSCPRAAAGVASDSSRVRGELELEPCVNFVIICLRDVPALSSPLLASPVKHTSMRSQKQRDTTVCGTKV